MPAARFSHYQHQTIDVNAASAFYPAVLGAPLWSADVTVSALPARAAAQGAPPHWLGHLVVADVEATMAQIRSAGGQALGPTLRRLDGALQATFRDPFGAVAAVSSAPVALTHEPVVWHMLHTADADRALAWYADLFGWVPRDQPALGPGLRGFAWGEAGPVAGSVSSHAALPGVHAQWLFCFPVPDVEAARGLVQTRGGQALETQAMASGARIAACGDPQGGAFALHQAGGPAAL